LTPLTQVKYFEIPNFTIEGLSTTGYSLRFYPENPVLARLKIHFSLLDTDFDEVDSVKPRYYGFPYTFKQFSTIVIFIIILIIYLLIRG